MGARKMALLRSGLDPLSGKSEKSSAWASPFAETMNLMPHIRRDIVKDHMSFILASATPSLSAIRTNSGSELASIFRMI